MTQENPTLDTVVNNLIADGREFTLVNHPRNTRTVKEKRRLLIQRKRTDYEPLYRDYYHIIIVQG